MLYFAYGSNLNHFQMKKRCKDSKYIKKFEIKDFRLTFRSKYGVADIEIKKNYLIGRGANDMKSSIACFVAAVSRFLHKNQKFNGSISFKYPLLENNVNLSSIKKGPLKLIFLISLK